MRLLQADISRRRVLKILTAGLAVGVGSIFGFWTWLEDRRLPFGGETQMVKLPEPRMISRMSVEQALERRRSRRDYTGELGRNIRMEKK